MRRVNDPLAATDGALLAVLLGDLRDEVHKDQRIDPLFDEGGDVLGEFQFVAVVAASGVGSLELADGAVTDEDDMDAALAELFEQGEKAGELLGEVNETLAVAESSRPSLFALRQTSSMRSFSAQSIESMTSVL